MPRSAIDFTEAMALSSIRNFVEYTHQHLSNADVFFGHGTDNPWDEAVCLVLDTLNLPADIEESRLDVPLSDADKQSLCGALDKRINQRLPLAYITHKTWFAGIEFYIDERALIPRSPIAELIEGQFSPWLASPPGKVLDLCTGGGCIAIACAYHLPEASVHGTDISTAALSVAQINNEQHQMIDRVRFYESDLFSSISERNFDVIVTNPPYVDEQDMNSLPDEFRHEPELALASGHDGLDIPRQIIEQAAQYLADDGILVLEVGNSAPALEQAFPELSMVWLEFERGGAGVCVIERGELLNLAR